MKQNYINHIALVLDASGSMQHLAAQVVQVADNQIAYLAQRSKELDQETRVTVYVFGDTTECIFYDKDVLRMPSLKGHYNMRGNTALVDASVKAIDDLGQTPELYGDHSFLIYVLTDGEENYSRHHGVAELAAKIRGLKENWTLACCVPDQRGKFEAKKFGFPPDNIAVWDTSQKGLSEVGEVIRKATDNYMTQRATGVRGSKNLFNLNTATLDKHAVTANLARLHPGQYRMAEVALKSPIAPFVEKITGRAYKLGEGYYQLTKTEEIQPQKKIALYDKKTHHVFTGDAARTMLGLPGYSIKVAATSHPDYLIFVQSGSVNRNLMPGTKLLLLS